MKFIIQEKYRFLSIYLVYHLGIAMMIGFQSAHTFLAGQLYSITHSWYLVIIAILGLRLEKKKSVYRKKFPNNWSKAIELMLIRILFAVPAIGLVILNLVPPFLGYYKHGII